jgi:hypothetical protein
MRFDIVVGNPPYGDVVTSIERNFIQGYSTSSINDIAANFVERELQLLAENGYFGNVITLRFVYESNAAIVRELLSRKMKSLRIACFTTRPSKVFDSSDPRVAIITGRKSKSQDHEAGFRTSRVHKI